MGAKKSKVMKRDSDVSRRNTAVHPSELLQRGNPDGTSGLDVPDGDVCGQAELLKQTPMDDSANDFEERRRVIDAIDYLDYEYPFENFVFEGGGAKGQVYVGCLEVLEELKIKPKRVAGASAGAICATLVAVGFSSVELQEVLEIDLEKVLNDHSCGICSLLPNLFTGFGWNPGNRLLKKIGQLLEQKGFSADLTFKELYQKRRVELCITAVNVNMLSCEYFHPKTTPDIPIRKAVRMSMSIPGMFQAVKVNNNHGGVDLYVDGGLVCNYPIHAFDGWWLSMKKGDSFLDRIHPLSDIHKFMEKKERFGEYNEKTLGFVVYSSLEQDLMQTQLDSIAGLDVSDRPTNSALYKKRAKAIEVKQKALAEHEVFMAALEKFLKVLMKLNKIQTLHDVNRQAGCDFADDNIDFNELKQALRIAMATPRDNNAGGPFDEQDVKTLFGTNVNIDKVFDELDVDDNGMISFDELMMFVERAGIDIQSKFQGYGRKDIKSVRQFAIGLQDCLLTNVKKMFLEEGDIHRSVGINTDYIQTTDFNMEEVDRNYCYQRGRQATISFLKHYAFNKNLPKQSSTATATPITTVLPSNLHTQVQGPAVDSLPPIRGGKALLVANVEPDSIHHQSTEMDIPSGRYTAASHYVSDSD